MKSELEGNTMTWKTWRTLAALALSVAVLSGRSTGAAEPAKKAGRDVVSLGILQTPTPEAVRDQARAWLKTAQGDKYSDAAFDALWNTDRTVLDRVADVLALGNADAAALLREARDPRSAAPEAVPALLRDAKQSAFFRANLSLAYAKALANRKVYEEALETLRTVKPEQVVDPATYLFTRAIAEYTLMLKKDCDDTINRLRDDVPDAPERYRSLAALMQFDMLAWQDRDLGWVSRKMGVIRDRLELTRGGKKTQQMQREVLVRLDEMIKELENKNKDKDKKDGPPNGGNCPDGSQPGQPGPARGNRPSNPAAESALPTGQQTGEAELKRIREKIERWGDLPEHERVQTQVEINQNLPPRYREVAEAYLDRLRQNRDTTIRPDNR